MPPPPPPPLPPPRPPPLPAAPATHRSILRATYRRDIGKSQSHSTASKRPQLLDKNKRDIGKSQSHSTASKRPQLLDKNKRDIGKSQSQSTAFRKRPAYLPRPPPPRRGRAWHCQDLCVAAPTPPLAVPAAASAAPACNINVAPPRPQTDWRCTQLPRHSHPIVLDRHRRCR
eukprot:COSAG01_NODE_1017_length_12107_cov_114.566372_13_plen_172_part_00